MANASLSLRIMAEPVRTVAFGAITNVYTGIGSTMTQPIRVFLIQNLTDVAMMISFDGISDHFPLAASGYMLLDITTNKSLTQDFFLTKGQRLYVKQLSGAASTGGVYLTTFYGVSI